MPQTNIIPISKETKIKLEQFNVSRETFSKLEIYAELLYKWQKAINLISPNSLKDFWERHILDSLQLIKYITDGPILDIGSGAGFPGAVLAIAANFSVTCLDSDTRKCLFLKELFLKTETKAEVANTRLESFLKTNQEYKTITARGFANLLDLLPIVYKYNSTGVFLKGKTVHNEIESAKREWMFHVKQFDSLSSPEGKILVIKDVKEL